MIKSAQDIPTDQPDGRPNPSCTSVSCFTRTVTKEDPFLRCAAPTTTLTTCPQPTEIIPCTNSCCPTPSTKTITTACPRTACITSYPSVTVSCGTTTGCPTASTCYTRTVTSQYNNVRCAAPSSTVATCLGKTETIPCTKSCCPTTSTKTVYTACSTISCKTSLPNVTKSCSSTIT